MVSPAPPSNSTLSGTTTAARPFCLSSVLTCWTKLSCLLEVVAQKSSRSTMSFSVETLPSSPTIIVLLFLPKGGLVSTTSKRSPGSAASASATSIGTLFSEPMPCSIRFIAHSRAVACTSSQPRKAPSLRWRFSSRVRLGLCCTM